MVNELAVGKQKHPQALCRSRVLYPPILSHQVHKMLNFLQKKVKVNHNAHNIKG